MSSKLWYLPQVIAFEMFENIFTFYDNISASDFPQNISCTNNQTLVIFVLLRENVYQNFFPSGKMFIGVMTNGASLENLNSQESHENCLYWTNYKIQPLADANYYI